MSEERKIDDKVDVNEAVDNEEIVNDESADLQKDDNQESNQGDTEQSCSEEEKTDGREEELEAKINELQSQVKRLEAEKEGYINRLQRLQADFANLKKRAAKEKSGLNVRIKIEMINNLLPIIDNFERALATAEANSDFKQGVDMIYRQVMDMLKKEGVEAITATGKSFDHNLHEAIMQVEDDDYESGTIVEELQKGYIMNDKVIRPAMVKVAQ